MASPARLAVNGQDIDDVFRVEQTWSGVLGSNDLQGSPTHLPRRPGLHFRPFEVAGRSLTVGVFLEGSDDADFTTKAQAFGEMLWSPDAPLELTRHLPDGSAHTASAVFTGGLSPDLLSGFTMGRYALQFLMLDGYWQGSSESSTIGPDLLAAGGVTDADWHVSVGTGTPTNATPDPSGDGHGTVAVGSFGGITPGDVYTFGVDSTGQGSDYCGCYFEWRDASDVFISSDYETLGVVDSSVDVGRRAATSAAAPANAARLYISFDFYHAGGFSNGTVVQGAADSSSGVRGAAATDRVTLTLHGTNPKITNLETGDYVSVTGDFTTTPAVLDVWNWRVTGAAESAVDFSGDFWLSLAKGWNALSLEGGSSATIEWRPQYL